MIFLLRHHLQIISELIRQSTQTDGRKEVDGESRVARVVPREESAEVRLKSRVLKSGVELLDSHEFGEFLEQDFDEDSTGAGRVVLVQLDALEDVPSDGVRIEKVREELADVPEPVGVQSVRCVVNVLEDLLELLRVDFVDGAEALGQQAVELLVGSLLGAAVEEHVAQLALLARLQLHPHQLVRALLEVQTRVDRQVNRAPQGDQVGLGVVDDVGGFGSIFVLLVAAIVIASIRV